MLNVEEHKAKVRLEIAIDDLDALLENHGSIYSQWDQGRWRIEWAREQLRLLFSHMNGIGGSRVQKEG